MPAKKGTAKGRKTGSVKKKTAPVKPAASRKPAATRKPPAGTQILPAEIVRKTIVYYYLLSYIPPAKANDFQKQYAPYRSRLVEGSGMRESVFFDRVIPEVSRRIAAFHLDTREPDPSIVDKLAKAARNADSTPESASAFQEEMARIAALPGRANPENRLHRNKGCRFCFYPCRYGYFSLVSDPQFVYLREILEVESQKGAGRQNPLGGLYAFAIRHLSEATGVKDGIIDIRHLANLSYCLLMLGMAKSRLPVPEQQLAILQTANREFVGRALKS